MKRRLEIEEVRERLASQRGAALWRSLEELAGEPEFEEMLHREFPRQAAEWPEGVDRRRFLQLSAASLALGGLTACTVQPDERIVPYVRQPEEIVPGRPLYFASAVTLDGLAEPVLVESHMGRPTKLEGNPEHPAGSRGTTALTQAAVLDLYDADRAQVVSELGRIRTWPAFLRETRKALRALEGMGGARVALLTETVTSPSLAAAIAAFREKFSGVQWYQYSAVGNHGARAGAQAAFGEAVETHYDLSRAQVVLALDSDFLTSGPGSLVHARDFMGLRRLRGGSQSMNRLYSAESTPTATGTLADDRLAVRPSQIARVAAAVAAELGVAGVAKPADADGRLTAWAAAVARDLAAHRGRSAVIPGQCAPTEVHTLAHAINEALGNTGAAVVHTAPVEAAASDQIGGLTELTRKMAGGEVDVLIVLGGNPAYDAPAELGFADAMLKVGRRIRWGAYEDETSQYCQWHVPAAHDLESWADARAADGTVTLLQPLIEPLYDGKTALEVVANLAGDDDEQSAYDLLRGYWEAQDTSGDFERSWRRALHDGYMAATAAQPVSPALVAGAASAAAAAGAPPAGLELAVRPDPTLHDGRFANNGWLQECPKPLTKLTWDNAALISPATARQYGLENGQRIALAAAGRRVEAPAWILPGHAEGTVTVHLGYGRPRAGQIGSGTGFDANPLRAADSPWFTAGATLEALEGTVELASTQLHSNMELETREAEKRHLVRVGSLDEYQHEPDFAQHMGHQVDPELTLFPPVEYEGHAWGMAIDLNACTGCNACVVACQSENNIPVVGKEQVLLGREMQWIRIDRYYDGSPDHAEAYHQPVMCMHCELAPCEVVCPVAATVHSDEGLNDMVYNRCVGTRYCANNCPYKVRRFNFLLYNDLESPLAKMMRNPDVTVRSRGVMEKCTYCVQRINQARIQAKTEHRSIEDGDIQTACEQVCPTEAIVFGDVNDPDSRVSAWKSEPRNYSILEDLNTRPRTTYLAKVRNAPAGEGEHA